MRSSYDGNILANSNIYSKDINSSRNFYGKSSKLENLQNLYFYLNPYSKSTSINVNQQLKQLKRFQSEGEGDELDKKYGKPIINNYKRFHIRAEEIKKGQGKNLDKNKLYTNYTPKAKNNPNLAFYSIADLSMLHPLTYQRLKSSEKYLTAGNIKYNTRLQMVDEKLKKLEEKNECLNIINDIFFDSIKDNLTQSLKRKAFLRKHLKDIEYLKQINLEEYNNKVNYLMNLVEQGQVDFDNYNFEGEPLNGMENMAGRLEALKTEIGTMLTKNTMKHDINLNLLKQDMNDVKDELEKKLMEFNESNEKNYEILKAYLFREEKFRQDEKKKKKQDFIKKRGEYVQETGATIEIKGKKQGLKLYNDEEEKEKEEDETKGKESTEEVEQSEISSETNKNIDVIDKILLDSISLSLTSNGKNIKSSKSAKTSKKSQTQSNKKSSKENNNDDINNNTSNKDEENEIALTSSSNNTKSKKSKKSKWKLLQSSEESNTENDINNNINEIKEQDESNINNNIITGSYKSKFDSNKPEIQSKSKRSKASKKFKLSKKSEGPQKEEENIPSKKSSKKSEKEKEKSKSNYSIKNEEPGVDDVIVGTESSSETTESFKITNRSNKFNLNSISENQEVLLSNDTSKNKSNNDNKSHKSKKSKKSKRKSKISESIKEKSKEEEDDDN